MANHTYTEGVRPGGLTTNKEIRILLCYLIDNTGGAMKKKELEEILLEEGLANYFLLAESLTQLAEQELLREDEHGFLHITPAGQTVARTLSGDLPKSICEAAVRGVIRAQQYAAKEAANICNIIQQPDGYHVEGHIGDSSGTFFRLELYMPDKLTAAGVRSQFIEKGDEIYKLVLAALTNHPKLVEEALNELSSPEDP